MNERKRQRLARVVRKDFDHLPGSDTGERARAHRLDGFVNRAPGFISATLHRSIDGTKVTMYARWRSMEDYQSMRQDPGPLPFLQEALTFATFEPGMYEIVRTFRPVAPESSSP
jgi:Antibiotic biosynthesis monooxygenase